jgi:hypothetical protein
VGGWVLSEFCIPRCAPVGGFHVSLTGGQGEGEGSDWRPERGGVNGSR